MTHSCQRNPASGLCKSIQNLTLDNIIKLTVIMKLTLINNHSFYHKALPKIFDNLCKCLKPFKSGVVQNVALTYSAIYQQPIELESCSSSLKMRKVL